MLETALKVLNIIEDNSYEAYIVGGFVRDYVMGIKSNDVDITTNARPKDLIRIFPNANIDNKIIKTVILPLESFKIDSLRILRAIRFATTLDFELSLEVKEAIMQSKYLLKDLSINRKKEELDKIFSSPNIEKGLSLIKDLDLMDVLNLTNINKIKPCSQVIGVWTVLEVDDIYPFTRNELKLMKDIRCSIKNNPLSFDTLYYYDLYPCTVAGELLGIDKKQIMDVYNEMPIHKRSDILIDTYDMLDYLKIEDGPIISELWRRIEKAILNLEVINDKSKLLEFAKMLYTSINFSEEDANEAEAAS